MLRTGDAATWRRVPTPTESIPDSSNSTEVEHPMSSSLSRRRLKATLATVSLSAVLLLLAGCASGTQTAAGGSANNCKPAHSAKTLQPGKLTVSTYNFPPAVIAGENGKLSGFEGDILNGFAKTECLSVNVALASGAGVIPAVQSGRADVAAGDWTLTTPRIKVLSHSQPFYYESMVLASNGGKVTSISQLKGLTVGTAAGNFWNDALNTYLGGNLKIYQSGTQAYQDVTAGRLDVVVDGFIGATQYLNQNPGSGLKLQSPQPLGEVTGSQHEQKVFYVPLGDTSLVKALNAYIKQQQDNGNIKRLLTKYKLPAKFAAVDPNTVLG
jgi:polar amino acid transport system substrate-binding protein